MAAATVPSDCILAPLRAEIELLPGPPGADGSPTGILHDTVAGTYDAYGWAEGEVLARLRRRVSLGDLHGRLRRETTVPVDREAVAAFVQSLYSRGLLEGTRPPDRRGAGGVIAWLMSHTLFFRLPLFRPDAFLQKTLWLPRFFGSRTMIRLYVLAAVAAVVLFIPRSGMFLDSATPFLAWTGALYLAAAVAAVKVLHEFSHAYAAAVRGVNVRSMGLFFMVMTPVPYCDVTDAWRLRKEDRLAISFAGVRTELVVGALSLLAWSLLAPGPLRDVASILSTASLASTILTNCNPGMRFDGYYLFSDLICVDNLQATAFAEARGFFHRVLLGADPEGVDPGLSRRMRTLLVAYSLYVVVYRLFVYFGLALVVYHLFPKAFGIILFCLEIAVLLVRPVVREAAAAVKVWRKKPSFRAAAAAGIGTAVLLWLFLPMPRTLRLQAAVVRPDVVTLYAPGPGRVLTDPPERGGTVTAGTVLLAMQNDDLDEKIAGAELEYEDALLRVDIARAGQGGLDQIQAALADAARLSSVLSALRAQNDQLTVRAATDVETLDVADDYYRGNHVGRRAFLARFAPVPASRIVVAYLPEEALGHVRPGDKAVFVSAAEPSVATPVVIEQVHEQSSRRIEEEALLGPRGGGVPVQAGVDGPVPAEALYRVEAAIGDGATVRHRPGQIGILHTEGRSRSRGWDFLKRVVRLLNEESGF
ncbi:MAG: hypothetical protein LIP18_06125 [Planctomycetes bacterium]|nr:hypothetical protein [Planctomycetota bacterium]